MNVPRGTGATQRRLERREADRVGHEGASRALAPDPEEPDAGAPGSTLTPQRAALERMRATLQDDALRPAAAVTLSISEDAQKEAVAAMLRGVQIGGDPSRDVLGHVRVRLEQFAVELSDELAALDVAPTVEPGETLPAAHPSPQAPPVGSGGAMAWTAIFAPEGVLTDDGRAFAPGGIGWRDLPLSLMAMVETTEGGHIGATLCGRIDNIWRDEEASLIRASGVFDAGDYGREIARLVADRTLSGLSVDLVIRNFEVGPRSDWFDDEGNWAPKPKGEASEPSLLDLLFGGDDADDDRTIYVVTDADIGMATVCPFPAFAEATIDVGKSLAASGSPAVWTVTQQAGFVLTPAPLEGIEVPADGTMATLGEPLTASAAGLAPLKPPADWFADPGLEQLTPLTITDDGRVYGHAAEWGSCHIAFPDKCVTPPHSRTGYAYFQLGEVEADDGSRHSAGKITFDTGHAAHHLGTTDATRHYDDTGAVAADVAAGEDEFGLWFAGAIRPDLPENDLRKLRAAVLSGDWRRVDGNLELVALLAVNVPGFPVPRTSADVVVASGEPEVRSLVAAGLNPGPAALGVAVADGDMAVAMQRLRARADIRFAKLAERAGRDA